MSFTPDGFPLLGESAARDLWLAEAIWVTHAAAAGAPRRALTYGDSLLDLHECDPERFDVHGPSRGYRRMRGAQGYREVYDVVHPRQQTEQARGLRTTPSTNASRRSARSSSSAPAGSGRGGTTRTPPADRRQPAPRCVGDALLVPDRGAEHGGLPQRAGWTSPRSSRSRSPTRRPGLPPAPRSPTTSTGPSGRSSHDPARATRRITCDLTVTRIDDDRFRVVAGGEIGRHDLSWLRRPPPPTARSSSRTTPRRCAASASGARVRTTSSGRGHRGGPLPRGVLHGADAHVGHVPCTRPAALLRRRARLGALRAHGVRAPPVGHAVGGGAVARGRGLRRCRLRLAAPGEGLPAVGPGHRRGARPLRGRPRVGGRLGKGGLHRPRRGGRGRRARGHRRLCCLVADDPAVLLVGKEPLLDGDTAVGYVTSAGYGATVGESILYGYLPVEYAEVGTTPAVHSAGGAIAVRSSASRSSIRGWRDCATSRPRRAAAGCRSLPGV